MDSYLTEIKQLRIPRPKYEPSGSPPTGWHRFVRPYTPPRDYHLPASESVSMSVTTTTTRTRKFQSGAEDFRKSLHDDL